MGDHDFKPTPTGKIVVDFVRGAMPAFLDTGLNVVDVRDVAAGHLAGVRAGHAGRAIHSGSENLTLQQIFADAGGNRRAESADAADSLRRGICSGSRFDGLGGE